MDTFIEQLIIIEHSTKAKIVKVMFWVAAFLTSIALILIAFISGNSIAYFICFIGAAAAYYLAFLFAGQLNIEYEYINTNGEIDIDCIVNKRKRQRMASFNCRDIESIESYNREKHKTDKKNKKNVYFACNPDSESKALIIRHPKNGYFTIVTAPNEEFANSMKRYLNYDNKKLI